MGERREKSIETGLNLGRIKNLPFLPTKLGKGVVK
jgi:CRISPR/Cas system CMR subunit Cmr6 (Cas7 group RAMP superfamily)